MKIFSFVFLASAVLFSCGGKRSGKQIEASNTDTGALYKKYNLDKIKLPAGFSISVYAEVPNARSMTLSPSGVL